MNHRISRKGTDGVKTEYAYGRNGALVMEKTGARTRSYVYTNGVIAGFVDSDSEGQKDFRYTAVDSVGSVSEIYSSDGETLWKSGYTAFGVGAGAEVNLIEFCGMFTGKDTDEDRIVVSLESLEE